MNETPYPPLPSVRRLVMGGASRLHRYPDHAAAELLATLAARLGVPAAQLVVGPGSAGLCQHLIQAIAPQGGTVVHAALSFEAYPLIIANAGARPVPVPLADHRHDLTAMADAVTADTRCVLVCNPNNPTGTVLHRAEIERFLDRIPPEVVVIVDEAYREFVTDPDVPDLVAVAGDRGNLCVLRTFSKAYGLAALRVGYAVAPPGIAAAARLRGAVFFPSGPGQAAAVASLDPVAEAELLTRCAELARHRRQLSDQLAALGLPVVPSQANFVWLTLGTDAEAFTAHCRRAGILVRSHPGQGVRITVGDAAANRRLVEVAAEFVVTDRTAVAS
ncbi:histidinol-phosphate aminotransferase [Micromonospora polyrhachis]|uniref:Histidinol-phosphate aminotransferase n=2 Tax=Micromonospora polyrhachis TaxID=1282883 RepID=A0A7W7WMZ4_9ACTN|nr:histidinol-phosphate aminotransferase [Micromonospora polyrhachis]